MEIMFQYIAQIDGNLFGILIFIPVIPGQFQCLPIISYRSICHIIVVKASDFNI